ncbi:diguanylate cyclase [Wenzhouxiangella sp. AB-CW3]|uniref:ligand-binding sensor domain-containing diguanylate cyclase n=1 Tax=Wenzhouxiangella sp. AB-CW3 TaxID=2771012 RepID=UPI00168A5939|nr:ligand-binding sensor domain-containing diguanylate cyclase [Wenzhouxiangella sp. AB-CW3]QOC22437.1 diguanylate cyclase [Wenzhouxiangella sp. AB-CW3]
MPVRARLRQITASLAVLLCAALTCPVQALPDPDRAFRDFVRDTWSLAEGLPQRSVTAIAQGPDNYLWVGTQHALARFDGVQFETYTTRNQPALPGNEISTLFRCSSGMLWIGSNRGLTSYDGDAFQRVHIGENEGSDELAVLALAEDGFGRVHVGSSDGLFIVDNGRLVRSALKVRERIGALHSTPEGLWAGGIGRYWRLDEGVADSEQSLPEDFGNALVTAFVQDGDALWVGTSAGLVGTDELAGVATREPVNAMLRDSVGSVWVAADQSLLRIRDGYPPERIDNDHPAAHPQARSLYEDHEQNLWIGSSIDGLARYWSGWADRYSTEQGLTTPLVWSVAVAGDGGIWTGTNDGLAHLHDGQFDRVLRGSELPHPHAYTLLEDDDGLWIGTRSGLTVLNPDSGEQWRPEALAPLDAVQINGIVPAGHHGRYFLATLEGLYLWDGEERLEQVEGAGNGSIRQVHRLNESDILVVTDNGVLRGAPPELEPFESGPELLRSGNFVAAHILDGDRLALSTLERGMVYGHDDRLVQLTMEQGLPSDSSYFLTHDDQDYLWVSSYEGLFRVPLAQLDELAAGERTRVDAEMLLSESGRHAGSQQGYCCNGAGHAKGLIRPDGLWLPSRDGVVRVRPDRIRRNPVPPVVRIERLQAGGEWHSLDDDQANLLRPGQRDLSLAFTALSFRDPGSVRFRFRLVGYDTQWQNPGRDVPRMASYTNLPPGHYRFEVLAANNVGRWSQQPATADIHIPAHFHETAWFWLLLVASTLLLLLAGYRWRKHQWVRQQSLLREEVQSRTAELHQANRRLVEVNRKLKDLSTIDTLTGLRNRRHLYERMREEPRQLATLRQQDPEADLVLGFALIDVDHFKRVNDEHGHHAGDRALEQVGDRLQTFVRKGDQVVRWGGEEFLVVFRALPRAEAPAMLDRLSRMLGERPYQLGAERALAVTCSIGFAELPPRDRDPARGSQWQASVDLADQALYQVKKTGRNGWAILRYDAETDPGSIRHSERNAVEAAIAQGRMQLISNRSAAGE